MSSILKALKRIEGQSPPPEAFPALPESVDVKQAVNSTARKRWRLRRIMSVCLILLIVVIASVTVFINRKYLISKISPAAPPATHLPKSQADGEKSKIFRAKIPMSSVKRATNKTSAPRQISKKSRSIDRSAQTRRNVEEQAPKSKRTAASRPPQSAATRDKPGPKPSAREKFTPSKKSIAGKRTVSPKPSVATRKTTKARTYAKLTDSKIKLQALAWSSDATRRMAVINGRIVREGGSTDGYQIDQIRKDDVVVSDGRQSWSLEFGLKR